MVCEEWCAVHTAGWTDKCKFGACHGCDACKCESWCSNHAAQWSQKCTFLGCFACDPCSFVPKWTEHSGTNCFDSSGARDLEVPMGSSYADDDSDRRMAVSDCQSACNRMDTCDLIVMNVVKPPTVPKCYRRTIVDLTHCLHDKNYVAYSKQHRPPLAPPPPPTWSPPPSRLLPSSSSPPSSSLSPPPPPPSPPPVSPTMATGFEATIASQPGDTQVTMPTATAAAADFHSLVDSMLSGVDGQVSRSVATLGLAFGLFAVIGALSLHCLAMLCCARGRASRRVRGRGLYRERIPTTELDDDLPPHWRRRYN
uniref:Uncharacterized protein n=1 Tax=Haptolina brevifila TaxID=156173 RepID=A0A7S2IPG2_9EUKA|mmetsp:Transcript_69411/g.137646  ORF Transcript_69411/g.137646 Transcript_69411/m.137646 type:complete len:311 (+) Transcript_69411:128-1060(+)